MQLKGKTKLYKGEMVSGEKKPVYTQRLLCSCGIHASVTYVILESLPPQQK